MLATPSAGLTALTWLEQKVQEGDAFIVSDYDSDVDIAGPKRYRVTTPNTTKYTHLIIEIAALTAGLFELYETPTESAVPVPGDAVTVKNLNRNSSTANTTLVKSDATWDADGTQIWRGRVQAAASPVSNRVPIALKTNTTYMVKFTSDGDNNKLWTQLIWIEHTDLI
jgi:hypothetical protein